MAIFRLQISSISRGAGRKVVAAAAYRSGERIRDERNRTVHNFSRRTDVSHKEIMLPSGLDASQIAWATDRAQLWNAAERAEHQRNARLAREFQVGLPHELSAERRRDLARAFARELSDRYKVAVDLAIHEPRPQGDPRNHHAHLLLTSREMTASGFGAKAGLDRRYSESLRLGLATGIAEIKLMRERWATLANEALRNAGLSASIDHRSLRAQGLDRLPRVRLPMGVVRRERMGLHSEIGERIRANHLARVRARNAEIPSQQAANGEPPTRRPSIEDVRQQAREAWLKMRGDAVSARPAGPKKAIAADQSIEQAAIDDDLAL